MCPRLRPPPTASPPKASNSGPPGFAPRSPGRPQSLRVAVCLSGHCSCAGFVLSGARGDDLRRLPFLVSVPGFLIRFPDPFPDRAYRTGKVNLRAPRPAMVFCAGARGEYVHDGHQVRLVFLLVYGADSTIHHLNFSVGLARCNSRSTADVRSDQGNGRIRRGCRSHKNPVLSCRCCAKAAIGRSAGIFWQLILIQIPNACDERSKSGYNALHNNKRTATLIWIKVVRRRNRHHNYLTGQWRLSQKHDTMTRLPTW